MNVLASPRHKCQPAKPCLSVMDRLPDIVPRRSLDHHPRQTLGAGDRICILLCLQNGAKPRPGRVLIPAAGPPSAALGPSGAPPRWRAPGDKPAVASAPATPTGGAAAAAPPYPRPPRRTFVDANKFPEVRVQLSWAARFSSPHRHFASGALMQTANRAGRSDWRNAACRESHEQPIDCVHRLAHVASNRCRA
jgi:hypothetical protein